MMSLPNMGSGPRASDFDNEISKDFKDHLKYINIPYQLVSPGDHRANPAEHAIQTFKNHFIAMLSETDPTFPENCLDLLIPQANTSLNHIILVQLWNTTGTTSIISLPLRAQESPRPLNYFPRIVYYPITPSRINWRNNFLTWWSSFRRRKTPMSSHHQWVLTKSTNSLPNIGAQLQGWELRVLRRNRESTK